MERDGFSVSEAASTRLALFHRGPSWSLATSKPASVEAAAKAKTGTAYRRTLLEKLGLIPSPSDFDAPRLPIRFAS
jgi:hypothetical protein